MDKKNLDILNAKILQFRTLMTVVVVRGHDRLQTRLLHISSWQRIKYDVVLRMRVHTFYVDIENLRIRLCQRDLVGKSPPDWALESHNVAIKFLISLGAYEATSCRSGSLFGHIYWDVQLAPLLITELINNQGFGLVNWVYLLDHIGSNQCNINYVFRIIFGSYYMPLNF